MAGIGPIPNFSALKGDLELVNLVRCADEGNVSGMPGCGRAYELGLIDRIVHPADGSYCYFLTEKGKKWLEERI